MLDWCSIRGQHLGSLQTAVCSRKGARLVLIAFAASSLPLARGDGARLHKAVPATPASAMCDTCGDGESNRVEIKARMRVTTQIQPPIMLAAHVEASQRSTRAGSRPGELCWFNTALLRDPWRVREYGAENTASPVRPSVLRGGCGASPNTAGLPGSSGLGTSVPPNSADGLHYLMTQWSEKKSAVPRNAGSKRGQVSGVWRGGVNGGESHRRTAQGFERTARGFERAAVRRCVSCCCVPKSRAIFTRRAAAEQPPVC